ncbi:Uncharacterized ABC transporter ATP-binding protein YheS [Chlamydiales bacterium SCGC AG-110-P3]|nr:Uncharacterized ABC transporter ATP-binding protein YheS [Chlamydiales bacterium SCGC AG-110-P3]
MRQRLCGTNIMIQFSKVKKEYGKRVLFDDVSFTLSRGERCGIVGRNGTGKSTLFRLITGDEELDAGVISKPKYYRIGTLEQHRKFSEGSILAETMLSLPPEERDEEYRAEIILTGLGFGLEDMDRSPGEFSGGFQLRLQLAKALIAEPDCLLLDEPTNYLDIVAIRWLEDALIAWQGELMVISHDKAFLDAVSTHTMGVYRTRVRKLSGGVDKFYEKMLLEDDIHERSMGKMDKKRAHMQSFIDRFGAKATKAAQARSRQKAIDKMSVMEQLAAVENLDFSFREAPFPGDRCLEVDGLNFAYETSVGGVAPFSISDFSIAIEKGERLAIVGKNGRGKSTLMSLMAGTLKPSKADWWISENLKIGYFGQTNIDRLHPDMTIEEEISAANPQLTYSEVKGVCGLMMFSGDQSLKKIRVLSGGERSRVLLGKILATPCNMLLLDEPTHHLDMESVEALLLAVKAFSGPVVLVTHDETLLGHFSERLIICRNDGIQVFGGDYETFLRKVGWEEGDAAPAPQAPVIVESAKEQREREAEHRKRMQKCENAISRAEAAIAEAQSGLDAAIASGDSPGIDKYGKVIADHQASIEQLFEELDQLSQQG